MVIVDTSVWVQAFRATTSPECKEVDDLLAEGRAAIVGVILAELSQGARTDSEIYSLYRWLTAMPYLPDDLGTWAKAGQLAFQLVKNGLKIPLPDLLIAALALEGGHELYTLDEHFQRIPGLKLHTVGAG